MNEEETFKALLGYTTTSQGLNSLEHRERITTANQLTCKHPATLTKK